MVLFSLAKGYHFRNNSFYITSLDIIRCLSFRLQAFGRPIRNRWKFEEDIFGDLRNLKPGVDAIIEEAQSSFLHFLYKNNCVMTKKKQKVFYWYSVPHDRLWLDALDRDLRREARGEQAVSQAVDEPALSFVMDTSRSLFEQLTIPLFSPDLYRLLSIEIYFDRDLQV